MKSKVGYKIGVSKNPKKRLQAIRIGNPNIELIYESKMISNANSIESALHKQFKEFALGNEWFCIANETMLVKTTEEMLENIGIQESHADLDSGNDRCVDPLLNWLFEPYKSKLDELDEEIGKIECDNRRLAEKLLQKGWTVDEIEELIAQAARSINKNVKETEQLPL